MLAEDAYNISDLYIQLMDKCSTVDEIFHLHTEMFTEYTRRMAELKKEQIYSKPVLRCIDYIHQHLHEVITLNSMADYVNPRRPTSPPFSRKRPIPRSPNMYADAVLRPHKIC